MYFETCFVGGVLGHVPEPRIALIFGMFGGANIILVVFFFSFGNEISGSSCGKKD